MNQSKILYVDDEVDLLDLAEGFFEEENLKIDTSSDFHGALELIRKNRYDVIVSDSKMPSGSGRELFKILKHELKFQGKFILVTGLIEKEDMTNVDYDLIIYKPIEFQELVKKVKSFLNGP